MNTPVLVRVKRITWELESGYKLEVKDKTSGEKPILVSDSILKELERRGDLRDE